VKDEMMANDVTYENNPAPTGKAVSQPPIDDIPWEA